jgi:hypothetical protein
MEDSQKSSKWRAALGTIVRGFLLGLGFSVALGGLWFVVWTMTVRETRAQVAAMSSETNYSSKDVVLSDVEEQKHDGLTAIIGTATNNGKVPARSVDIQAELFNHGKFVDQYSTYLSGVLAPGASKHFKISCGCKDSPAAEHDSYKVTVISD